MRKRITKSEARKALACSAKPPFTDHVVWRSIRVRDDTFADLHRLRALEGMHDVGLGAVVDMLIENRCSTLTAAGRI